MGHMTQLCPAPAPARSSVVDLRSVHRGCLGMSSVDHNANVVLVSFDALPPGD